MLRRLAGVAAVARPYDIARSGEDVGLILHDHGARSLHSLGLAGLIGIPSYLDMALQLAEALHDIHERGVIHNDINPDHVLLNGETQQLQIIGFSRSLVIERSYGGNAYGPQPRLLTHEAYTSPEQTGRLERGVDFRSDYYLLGLTLFEMLTGLPPFRSSDPLEVLHAHLARVPADPRELRVEAPASLSRILLTLLAKDADERYQSTDSLRRDLQDCRRELSAGRGAASKDGAPRERFRVPDRLYGRQLASEHLSGAVEQAQSGRRSLVTIVGAAGVGKSTLVAHVLAGVSARGGTVMSGKFDPSEPPYTALRQALEGLASSWGSSPAGRAFEQSLTATALGQHAARVLMDFCPALGSLLGPRAELEPLPARQAGTRLSQSLGCFLGAAAEHAGPVCLFFDDVQWAGEDALTLLRELLCAALPEQLLLVLAYRPSPTGDADQVVSSLGVDAATVQVSHLMLDELCEADVCALVADALTMDTSRAAALASVVFARTKGNPFFVRSFLAALHADGLIQRNAAGWDIDLGRVSQRSVTDNVVGLLLQRISQLPEPTRDVLAHAAVLGPSMQLATLDHVMGRSSASDVALAIDAELILPPGSPDAASVGQVASAAQLRFAHDRIRQAVLQTLDEAVQLRMHRDIGLCLLGAQDAQGFEAEAGSLFDIVRLLNHAAPVLDTSTLLRLAALNLQAARVAMQQGAGVMALQLARQGCRHVGEAGWQSGYSLTLALHQTAAEAAFAWADHDAFEPIAADVLAHAQTPLARAQILRLIGRVRQAEARSQDALDTYRRALADLGVALPAESEAGDVRRETARLLEGYDADALLNLPVCTDPVMVLAMELLSKLVFFAYSSANPLLPVVVCKLVNLSVVHGNTSESANGYTFYGRLLSADGELDTACRFGQLALDLVHRFPDPAMLSQTYLYANLQVMHWKVPPVELVANFERAVVYGLEAGSPLNAAASATTLSICRFWAGDHLPTLARAMAAQRPMIERFRQRLVLQWHDVLAQAIQNLCGPTEAPTGLLGPLYDERERLASNARSPSALFNHHVWKMVLCFTFGDVTGALAACDASVALKPAFMPGLWAIPVTYFDCLCQLAGMDAAPSEDARAARLAQARRDCDELERWVLHNPAAVESKLRLVRAELARVSGDRDGARRLFREATTLAEQTGTLSERGIAHELAARFNRTMGDTVTARAHARKSQRAYFSWGALAKVRALESQYPDILPPTVSHSGPVNALNEPQQFDALDLLSVVNANRLLSGAVTTQALLPQMMSLVVENGGAELGYLLLERHGRWFVAAGQSSKGQWGHPQSIPLDELPSHAMPGVAVSVIEHVARSNRAVLLDDAAMSSAFADDPHIAQDQTVSLLCFPMTRAGEQVAIVYLENNLARGAFTKSSLAVLEMLCLQAVVSLENATLYESLELKVDERTRQLREKNEELASALARVVDVQRQMMSQEKLAELGALAAGIAHEIKNPLNFVTNFAGVARELALEIEEITAQWSVSSERLRQEQLRDYVASFRQAVDKIVEHGARATGIINGMALHARASGGKHELVDLNYVLEQSLVLAAHGSAKAGFSVPIATSFDPELGPVEVGVQDISRVVVNLIGNAFYSVEQKRRRSASFTPTIRLSSHDRGDTAEIRVRDNGMGVAASVKDRLFLPFVTTKPGEGTGLGLSISHDIVVRGHQGMMRVESVEGEYAEFIVVLPKRQLALGAGDAAAPNRGGMALGRPSTT